jgi:hypothetical protein
MTQSVFIRRTVAIIVLTVCITSWLALGATFIVEAPRMARIIAAFAAAFSTEALFWIAAGLLGWKAFERFSIWSRLTGRKKEIEA